MKKPLTEKRKIPPIRKSTMDFGRISRNRHSVYGMLEIDVTNARENIKNMRKSQKVSFFAWLVQTICAHIADHPEVAGMNSRGRTLHIFDEVRASVMIEKNEDGQKIPHVLVIEDASNKSAAAISEEIDEAKNKELRQGQSVLNRKQGFMEKLYFFLPGFLRRMGIRFVLRNPRIAFPMMGNVVITSVGMVGKVHGWFIPATALPLSFGVGSVLEKPRVINGEIIARQILNVTVNFDHDIIDGAEMARFINSLVKRIEAG